MMRIMLAAVAIAVVVGSPVRADDNKSVRDTLKEILEEYKAAQKPLAEQFQAARDEDAQNAVLAKLPALAKPFGEKAYQLAKENPKDPLAPECLNFAIQAAHLDKAGELLLEIGANPKAVAETCMLLMSAAIHGKHPAGEKFLKLAIVKAKEKEVQGAACLAIARVLFAKSDTASDEKTFAALLKSAEEYATKAVNEYADVDAPREGKLGTLAKRVLFQIRNLAIGMTAPEVVSRDLEEKETKLSALRGKVVVLDFWATWCGPCVAMIPHETEMVEKLKDKPFALVSVNADEDKADLLAFLKKKEMPWTHWWEGERETGVIKDWNVDSFPTVYVLDAKGVIRHKGLRGAKLEDAVEKLVKEAEKK